ncbi:MAG: hypothetical protein JWP13_67 [Candidatus Saccharibacteria bacterium]|nr:hypothetical protein [Candidatus Saccharibacteria bacterium]
MDAHRLFESYLTIIDGVTCYFAGLPGYPRNFSRDTLIAGIIAADHHLLDSQLRMSALHQGAKNDPITGEEPGKIHHEYPGVIVHSPYFSTYNACDTTALYLIGLEILRHLSGHDSHEFLATHKASINSALEYLNEHTLKDIFWEFPPKGAAHFSLHTTYWKDSIVPSASGKEEPVYPVTYALAQFQAARGILAAARLLGRHDLLIKADRMFIAGINEFITEKFFCIEQDAEGPLRQPSSDELHALAYIPEAYASLLPLDAIAARALHLVTPAGIACTPQEISDRMKDTYHGYVVWIFEQALIHYGTRKFGLRDLAQITKECAEHIDTGHELLSVIPHIKPRGNTHQLWSVAAGIYFSDEPSLRQTAWL